MKIKFYTMENVRRAGNLSMPEQENAYHRVLAAFSRDVSGAVCRFDAHRKTKRAWWVLGIAAEDSGFAAW